MFVESFAALGTNPVPMAFPELYGALESKAMDAQENPFAFVLNSKFYEVQKGIERGVDPGSRPG
jgi:TRAP-type C4-dicarboxylate transport system substrate-binding protein